MWDDQHDAQMRVYDTVIRYHGEPMYVDEVDDELFIHAEPLKDGLPRVKAHVKNRGWNFKPVPTGYMNVDFGAVFVARYPCRKWKQGLHRDNVVTIPHRWGFRAIRRAEFRNVVLNKYPTWEECYQILSNHDLPYEAMAFHRLYAVEKDPLGLMYLMYRGERIGWFQDDKPMLGLEYNFLKEELQEALNEHR